MQINGKFQGVTVNLTGNPGGQLEKNQYSQQGLYHFFFFFFFGKAQYKHEASEFYFHNKIVGNRATYSKF